MSSEISRLPPPMFFFLGGTNQELVINTELCDLAMTMGGLIQVGKSRIENDQPNRTDRYTINV